MGKEPIYLTAKDEAVYEHLSDNEVFADLYNGSVFRGNQVIDPDMLEEANEKKQIKITDRGGQPVVVKRIRDVEKRAGVDGGILSIALAVEGQREVHYGMPLRSMLYDAVDYMKQMQELERYNKKNKRLKGRAEFLSGLRKEDRLLPVFTIVFYYGESQLWDGPMCLQDMLEFPSALKPWRQYLPDYPLNLVYSHNVVSENFRTGLREVFELLNVAGDKKAMGQFLKENKERYGKLEWKRGELIRDFLEMPFLKNHEEACGKGGRIDMCTAFQQMYEEGEAIGEARGEAIGEARGESRMTRLMQCLLRDNKMDEVRRAAFDAEYRKELYKEYNL